MNWGFNILKRIWTPGVGQHRSYTVKMTLKGKTFRKWASGQNTRIYEFEKEIKPRGYSDPVTWGCIHAYDLYSQTSLLVYISVMHDISSKMCFVEKDVTSKIFTAKF